MISSKARIERLIPVVMLLMVFITASSGYAAIKMTPYLQAVTTNSVYVLVECDSTSSARVDYGTTTSYGNYATTESTAATTASPVTYVHNIKLTGLQPNTAYHYKVTQGGGSSADSTFSTAVNPGTNFRFAFMADFRSGTSVHNTIAGRVKSANPRFSIYGGDLCADSSYGMFKSEFFLPNELALISKVPFFNTPGNHETWATDAKAFTQAPSSSSGTLDYYSFDYGDVHFVCINNEVSYSSGSTQYNWVKSDLAATTKPWKIVFFHKPAYCAGGHGEDSEMKTMTSQIFEPYKVDLALTGHSHFYQHNLVNGIHHMVIGTVGAPLADPGTASYVKKSSKSYCYGIIDVTPTTLHLVVYNDSGSVLDTLDLTKQVAPAAPASLTASPVSSSQINLSWADNSSTESGFKIERSADGSNFSQIASTAANVTSYSDTGLSANTKYYYRVRAYNTVGDSAYSNTVSVTTAPTAKQVQNIGKARAEADGAYVNITTGSIVTLDPPETGVFYAQDPDGTAGIRVEVSGTKPAVGSAIYLTGKLTTKPDGERALTNALYNPAGTAPAAIVARGMTNKTIGGAGYVGAGSEEISNQGLLAMVWGRVTKAVNDPVYGPVFWIDDGSRVDAAETDGTPGVKVIESDLTPSKDSFVRITGVISSEIKSGKMIRVIRFKELLP